MSETGKKMSEIRRKKIHSRDKHDLVVRSVFQLRSSLCLLFEGTDCSAIEV